VSAPLPPASTRVPPRSPRAVALLMVLGTLVVVSAFIAALAAAALEFRQTRATQQSAELAEQCRLSAEAVIERWLRIESASVCIPPLADRPCLGVLSDRISLTDGDGTLDVQIRIDALDQCGLLSWRTIQNFPLLTGHIPPSVLSLVRAQGARIVDDRPPAEASQPTRVVPVFEHPAPTTFGQPGQPGAPGSIDDSPAVLSFVADPSCTELPVNVNTAPAALLRALLAGQQVSAVENVLAARRQGAPYSGLFDRAPSPKPAPASEPSLTTTSQCWAFRVDVRVNRYAKSWWLVYRRSDGQPWRMIVARVIAE
jgi:hypothetical protein